MAYTGTDVLSMIQGRLIEPRDGGVSWPSGLWDPREVHRYLDEQQAAVIRETGCVVSIANIPPDPVSGNLPAGTLVVDLPGDCIAVVRVAWIRASDGQHLEITPVDLMEADMGATSWPTGITIANPRGYTVGEADSAINTRGDLNRLRLIDPLPAAGSIEVWYIAQPAPLAIQGNPVQDDLAAADLLTVPDVGMPAVLWGTLETMTAKVARGAAGSRASYAHEMREIAIEAMQVLLRGWDQ